ncbi:hypothetical protein JAAARDRAFT_493461 [Jaapia argillacea MUCL 33604]|uniref:DUF6697 domain-containing protein n=1 Tax=Jaapia argillacea MUCL 33604 TaxID=933084 RepID=A0A067PBB0_9AGAM|nr:hypothetical protein JAAARDRAFT_493461 [Jaapia argillacea MUCL 33604]
METTQSLRYEDFKDLSQRELIDIIVKIRVVVEKLQAECASLCQSSSGGQSGRDLGAEVKEDKPEPTELKPLVSRHIDAGAPIHVEDDSGAYVQDDVRRHTPSHQASIFGSTGINHVFKTESGGDTITSNLLKAEDADDAKPPPSKRRKTVLDSVFITSLPPHQIRRCRSQSGIGATSSEIRSPKMDVKAEEIDEATAKAKLEFLENTLADVPWRRLPRRMVYARLQTIKFHTHTINYDESKLHVAVSPDKYLSKVFGGNFQSRRPSLGPKFIHPYDEFMFLHPGTLNPEVPKRPGLPGIFLGMGDLEKINPSVECRVIVRLRKNMWLYVGQYKPQSLTPLSVEEWMSLSDLVKRRWVKCIVKEIWAEPIRVQLRHNLQTNDLTNEDIDRAFTNGDLQLSAWSMKCVGYDQDFQNDIVSNQGRDIQKDGVIYSRIKPGIRKEKNNVYFLK